MILPSFFSPQTTPAANLTNLDFTVNTPSALVQVHHFASSIAVSAAAERIINRVRKKHEAATI